jgi:WD40 repeat protein
MTQLFLLGSLFFCSNAIHTMHNKASLSLQEYYGKDQPKLIKRTLELPQEILLYIFNNNLTNQRQLWFESQQFPHDESVNAAYFNTNEDLIITFSDIITTQIWNILSGQEIKRFQNNDDANLTCLNTNKIPHLTTTHNESIPPSLNIKLKQEIKRLQYNTYINTACFNSNKDLLLTAADDKTARLWSIKSKQEIQHFQHDGDVNSAYFNTNEDLVLTASNDRTARIWQKYDAWTLDQFLLYQLLFTWLLVQKVDKKIKTIQDFIKSTRIYEEIDQRTIKEVYQTFPEPVQKALWEKIKIFIQKYGK